MGIKKNDVFRIKIDYEEIPITDQKVKGIKGMDELFKSMKKKFKGDR